MFTRKAKVLFQHCDPAGIVFYPRWFEMVNETVEAWFEERLGVSFAELHGPMGLATPTAALSSEFSAPGRHGEELLFSLKAKRVGGASLDIEVTASAADERKFSVRSTLVLIRADTGRPERWPDELRARLCAEINEESGT